MKKIFLLLACVATLSACNTNTGGEDPLITRYKQIGALFYLGTLNQLAYNLDPFDMAFRLNTLITETQNEGGSLDDLNSSALKTRLFGATTITKEGPVYTLNLATVAPDDIRSGTIRINTADGTLKDGHTWTLSLPKDEYRSKDTSHRSALLIIRSPPKRRTSGKSISTDWSARQKANRERRATRKVRTGAAT